MNFKQQEVEYSIGLGLIVSGVVYFVNRISDAVSSEIINVMNNSSATQILINTVVTFLFFLFLVFLGAWLIAESKGTTLSDILCNHLKKTPK